MNKIVTYFDVLGSRVKFGSVDEGKSQLVIIVNDTSNTKANGLLEVLEEMA